MTLHVFTSDDAQVTLPVGHRFPMEKYRLLRQGVEQLDGVVLRASEPATVEQLALVHSPDYLDRVLGGRLTPLQVRKLGFPWSQALVYRARRSVGATIAGALTACERGLAVSLAGGTHHAFADRGEGYCLFNDVAVAIRHLRQMGVVSRVSVIDLDVHQGDGTASIFFSDSGVYTLSLHGRTNYPFHKQVSDCDVALEDGCGDAEYLQLLEAALEDAVAHRPDLVFFLAGADPFSGDKLGKLSLTLEGLQARDRLVLQRCRDYGVPVMINMAGGYAEPIEDTVNIHLNTVCIALEFTRTHSQEPRRCRFRGELI